MKASKIQNLLALSIVVILGFSNFALAQLSCSQASSCAVIGTPNPLACTSGVTFREDFTESGSPGFDSNDFVHSISGNTAFDNEFSGSNPLAPFPSSPDALILFVAQDDITFSLA